MAIEVSVETGSGRPIGTELSVDRMAKAGSSKDVRSNRQLWDKDAAAYERRNARALSAHDGMSWGFWRIPETRLHLLRSVRGKEVLELGCGAGRWALGLRRRGAHVVALDLSRVRLRSAASILRKAGVRVPLLQVDAEWLPFRSGRFDIVFCDWGAMTFADPDRTVPEAARVLRRGGRLAFSTSSPIRVMCTDVRRNRLGRQLARDYFSLHRQNYGREVNFQLPYSGWIDLFARSGLVVERLIEPRSPPSRRSAYLSASESRWGREWPLESIWALTKAR